MRTSALLVTGLAGVAIARPVDPADDAKATKAAVKTGVKVAVETATTTTSFAFEPISTAEPPSIPELDPVFIQIPTSMVQNVVNSVEYVHRRFSALRSTVENDIPKYGYVPGWKAKLISNDFRTPTDSLSQILDKATHIAKTVGLDYLTPVNETDSVYNFLVRPCNGTCLYEKAKKIVDMVDTFDHAYADRTGMEAVDAMVHRARNSAQALVDQLGGDEAEAYIDAIRGPKPEEPEEEEEEPTMVDKTPAATNATKAPAAIGTDEAETEAEADDETEDDDEADDDDDEEGRVRGGGGRRVAE